MDYKNLRRMYISIDEMNDHLKYIEDTFAIKYREKAPDEPMARNAFIEDKLVYFKLTYKRGSDTCTYITRKDGVENHQYTDGGEAFKIMCQYYKVPRMPERICGRASEGGLSASPLLWINPKYERQWVHAYSYDMNSAYSAAMLGPMPDTRVEWHPGKIKKGLEIGFKEVLNPKNELTTMLVPQYEGYSLYVFPLIESPFEKFVNTWYSRKMNAIPGSPERDKAKGVLNYCVGYLQRVNPFIRATIIGLCNDTISSMIDEYSLFCNTDSIVSLRPLDLPIGTGIGEWKLENEGKVAYVGNNYQWQNGDVSYRGVPKSWFPKGWDITKDPVPNMGNIYEFSRMRLRRVKK